MLFWDGYTIHGTAWYDHQGQLTELTIWGEKGRAGFTLELRRGALPFTCCVDMGRDDAVSEFNGVEITGWSRGYDTVEVEVNFLEGIGTARYEPVDIRVPESYDTRLYEIPWCDSVPDEYQLDFYSVTFRAEDMSPEAVAARAVPHDTGGSSFHFNVLHPNGVVVSYSCDGMTAQEVWELVEGTLP